MDANLKQAVKIAIECIEYVRRQRYAQGEAMWQAGHRADVIDGKDEDGEYIEGAAFEWVEGDHKNYVKYSRAIETLKLYGK